MVCPSGHPRHAAPPTQAASAPAHNLCESLNTSHANLDGRVCVVPASNLGHSLSVKIPFRGCVFKESVKVCTPKSPAFSDDFAPDFAPFYVFPRRSGTQTKHFGCLTECQIPFSDPGGDSGRCRSGFRGMPITGSGMMAIMIPG